MSQRATEIANALLRLGVLDPDDPEQQAIREELLGDAVLFADVRARLDGVGYDLVQLLGHIGVRLQRATAIDPLVTARNNLGLDARHVRVLVYLWVQLLYRQLREALRDAPREPRGRRQVLFDMDDDDNAPTLPRAELEAEFGELYAQTTIKGALTKLKRHRFVQEDGGRLRAGPAMYVLIDHERMEEHVVGLARQGALELP